MNQNVPNISQLSGQDKIKIAVTVNGDVRQLLAGSNVQDLIQHLKQDKILKTEGGVALARNGSVVAKGAWPTTILSENDQILIIIATQGG